MVQQSFGLDLFLKGLLTVRIVRHTRSDHEWSREMKKGCSVTKVVNELCLKLNVGSAVVILFGTIDFGRCQRN